MQAQRIPGGRRDAATTRSVPIDFVSRLLRRVRRKPQNPIEAESAVLAVADDEIDAFVLEHLLSRFPAPQERTELIRLWAHRTRDGRATLDIADAAARLEGDGLIWQVGPILGVTTAAIRSVGLLR